MSITRLTGGLTPGDGADPRTFPAIFNALADDIDSLSIGTAVATQGQVLAYSTAVPGYVPSDAGVPAGGSAGQFLAKDSSTDFDAVWVDGFRVFSYGTAIPSARPDAEAVYWRGTAVPGTAIAQNGDLWYDTSGD